MLIQLGIMGLLAAILPLTMVWVSSDANKYRKLAAVTLFLTFDLIIFGGFTRLTDSGLGCPDWPGCYGHANPFQAHEHISAAQSAMPTGPVTVFKAWIEMIHRYLAMGVGVLIVSLMVIAWLRWIKSARRHARFAPAMPTLLFLFVCLQGAFGAFTVTMKLQPIIVTCHLLLGLGLLAMLTWLHVRQREHPALSPTAVSLRGPALLGALLLFVQLALGGWVSTNYAALACTDFPTCHGVWLPQMDFENGFTLWRKLGMTADGEYLPFPALTAIHYVHRSFAFVVAAVLGWLALRAMKISGMQVVGRCLLAALAVQLCTGLATVYFNWPLAIAVLHNAGAALLVLILTMLNYKTRLAPHGAPASIARPPTAY
ncbi:COX15/CtaA family protein [Actimicrobium antarcticum]|uniref:COX15/CtaA family protein n=1 Tax=Actimicrobium antarcticum TaxID=1051899 RepID=A0ABP7T9M8_9BURK